MPDKDFPRTMVGGISLPRMIIGCNWLTGFSHTSAAADTVIRKRHADPAAAAAVFKVFMAHNIDAVLGLFAKDPKLLDAVHMTEEATGRKMILMDEPILNVDDNAAARREAERTIKDCAARGATFCLPLHKSVEQLVNKNKRSIERLPDYLYMIREAGMIPGLSSHMPELIEYADTNEYDVETYIQIYNCLGFLMPVEIETVSRTIHNAKKPVLTIKALAAGRTTPYVGLNFNYATIRPTDMVAIGCFDAAEAKEDVEIARAAIERRYPDITGRNSPLDNAVIQ